MRAYQWSEHNLVKLYKWLFLLLLILAACAMVESTSLTSTPTSLPVFAPVEVNEAIRRDAEELATESGISIDEAIWRVSMMKASGDLNARLEQNEADTFAGMWLQHEPDFRIMVAFTQNGEKTIRPYVENTPLADIIEVRTADVTLLTLYATEIKTHQIITDLGLSLIAYTTVNILENQVEIHGVDRALLETKLREAHIQLPDHVEILMREGFQGVPIPGNITPVPDIHFPQLVAPPAIVYALGVNGQVILQDRCLRLVRDEDEKSYLLIWNPGYILNDNEGVIEVLGPNGDALVQVGGLSCFSPAEGKMTQKTEQLLREPLPEKCSGPYFFVGDVRLSYQPEADPVLVNVDLISLGERSFYFIQKKSPIDDWTGELYDLSGKLVLNERSRCLRIQSESAGYSRDDLLLWPPDYAVRVDLGKIEIVDGLGQVVARVGEEVRLSGSGLLEVGEIREPLYDELPCDCAGGDYIVVEKIIKSK